MAKPGSIFATAALAAGGLLVLKWAADLLANWWVQRQGTRQGVTVQVPPVVNPFTQDPPSPLAQFFYLMTAAAATAQHDPELIKQMPAHGKAWLTQPPTTSPPA